MENIEEFVRKKFINIDELCEYLDISKPTYYTWVREKKPENIQKIAQAINKMADDLKIGVSSITQGAGSIAGGMVKGNKVFNASKDYSDEVIKLQKEKIAFLEEKNKVLEEQVRLKEEEIARLKKVK